MKKYLVFIFLLVLLSCSKEKEQVIVSDGTLTVGTFNLEWLGDGVRDRKDRAESDYKNIAEIIIKTKADILAVQEIENPAALVKIIRYLPNYSFYVGRGGAQQNLGFIFKKNVQVKLLGDYAPLAVEYRRTRPGLVVSCKKDNFDFIFMAVHLKSSSHWDNTEEKQESAKEIRAEQAVVLANWADSALQNGKENDLIIAGDFNDTPVRKKENCLLPLMNDKKLNIITAEMKSCKYRSMYGIDHIILSSSASGRFIKNTERAYDFRSSLTKEQADKISDHCPVLLQLDSKKSDND